MKMIKVKSSNIESVGFANGTLRVKFIKGTAYEYSPITEQTFNDLLKAESVGKFFIANIRDNPNIKTNKIA